MEIKTTKKSEKSIIFGKYDKLFKQGASRNGLIVYMDKGTMNFK